MKLLGLDCETTGLHENANLLTLYMGVLDENFNIMDSIDLKLKPEPINGKIEWSIQIEAMQVNKIDIFQHEQTAITYKEAKPKIYNWIADASSKFGELIPFGNMINKDIDKICDCVISRGSWESFVDRRTIELLSIGRTLQFMGKIPRTQSLSLSKIAEYLGVEVDKSKIHTAQYDVLLGSLILREYLHLM